MRQEKRLEEKLNEVLAGRLTQVELEMVSELEESMEGEESEVVGSEDVRTTGGTQSLVMEVDEEEEDEVVEVKRVETRKWALLSPPKMSRKRVHAAMATQSSAGSQVQRGSVQGSQTGSGPMRNAERPCDRCVKHRVPCMVASGGVQCEYCQAKHYRCSLVLAREVVGGRGGPLGFQQAKVAAGSQQKGWRRKARKLIMLSNSHFFQGPIVANIHIRSQQD